MTQRMGPRVRGDDDVFRLLRRLLRDLTEHATREEFVHVHKWTLHDLVMWDNRQTMHRVRRYDQSQPRDMRRATVAGTQPTVAEQAAE